MKCKANLSEVIALFRLSFSCSLLIHFDYKKKSRCLSVDKAYKQNIDSWNKQLCKFWMQQSEMCWHSSLLSFDVPFACLSFFKKLPKLQAILDN